MICHTTKTILIVDSGSICITKPRYEEQVDLVDRCGNSLSSTVSSPTTVPKLLKSTADNRRLTTATVTESATVDPLAVLEHSLQL